MLSIKPFGAFLLFKGNFMLEKNKIYLGDCLELMKEIPDKSIDMILTDIPYNEANRKSNGLRNLDKDKADICEFSLSTFLLESNRICKGSFYIFCGFQQIRKNHSKFFFLIYHNLHHLDC